MTHSIEINHIQYTWHPGPFAPRTLYGVRIVPASLIPDGMVMTLRNVRDERLVLRGEMHGEGICFYHIEGEGGVGLIGEWVRAEVVLDETPAWATALRERLMCEMGGRK